MEGQVAAELWAAEAVAGEQRGRVDGAGGDDDLRRVDAQPPAASRVIGGGATPPGRTVYVRRWSIEPLPANPANLSEGTGPVTIDKNVISENLANDDGGGIRLLQVSGSHVSRLAPGTVTITNNTVTENISTHEGGGIALDDAAFTEGDLSFVDFDAFSSDDFTPGNYS